METLHDTEAGERAKLEESHGVTTELRRSLDQEVTAAVEEDSDAEARRSQPEDVFATYPYHVLGTSIFPRQRELTTEDLQLSRNSANNPSYLLFGTPVCHVEGEIKSEDIKPRDGVATTSSPSATGERISPSAPSSFLPLFTLTPTTASVWPSLTALHNLQHQPDPNSNPGNNQQNASYYDDGSWPPLFRYATRDEEIHNRELNFYSGTRGGDVRKRKNVVKAEAPPGKADEETARDLSGNSGGMVGKGVGNGEEKKNNGDGAGKFRKAARSLFRRS